MLSLVASLVNYWYRSHAALCAYYFKLKVALNSGPQFMMLFPHTREPLKWMRVFYLDLNFTILSLKDVGL